MSEGDAEYLCIADTDGLHGIAAASGNLKTVLLSHLPIPRDVAPVFRNDAAPSFREISAP